jgi:hypothetical protein
MIKMRQTIDLAVGLISGLGAFGCGIAADRWVFSPAPGDHLAFAGALIGSAAAVVGALVVAEATKRSDERERDAFWYAAINDVVERLKYIRKQAGWHSMTDPRGPFLKGEMQEVERGLQRIQTLASVVPPTSLALLKAYEEVPRVDDGRVAELEHQIDLAIQYPSQGGHLVDAAALTLLDPLNRGRSRIR